MNNVIASPIEKVSAITCSHYCSKREDSGRRRHWNPDETWCRFLLCVKRIAYVDKTIYSAHVARVTRFKSSELEEGCGAQRIWSALSAKVNKRLSSRAPVGCRRKFRVRTSSWQSPSAIMLNTNEEAGLRNETSSSNGNSEFMRRFLLSEPRAIKRNVTRKSLTMHANATEHLKRSIHNRTHREQKAATSFGRNEHAQL